MHALLVVMMALALRANAMFNCKFELDGHKYDLTALKGDRSVASSVDSTPRVSTNYTWWINPCELLDRKNVPEETPHGVQVLGLRKVFTPDNKEGLLTSVIPVSGDIHGNEGGSKRSKIDQKDKKGVKVEYRGGEWGDATPHAEVEFLCADKDDLSFDSWDDEILKLTWHTKEVCVDKRDKPKKNPDKKPDDGKNKDGDKGKDDKNKDDDKDNQDESSSWGFFTWLFFIGILAFGVYVVAGAWINSQRYGLSGIDMLPHSDTLRDLPYLIRDFVRKAIGSFSGSSNRGGYSAV